MFFWKRVRNLLVTHLMLLTSPVWVFPFCVYIIVRIIWEVKIKRTDDSGWIEDFNMIFRGDRMLIEDRTQGIQHKTDKLMRSFYYTTLKLILNAKKRTP